MEESYSINALKALVEKKMKKKIVVKVMWNNKEKITLFLTPNMKINSFIHDEKEGYVFYDHEGKLIESMIPCILPEEFLINGKVILQGTGNKKLWINNQPLSQEDMLFLREF